MAYFNPDHMTDVDQQRIAHWLEANGCRDWIALEPIVLRGNIAEYTAICRKGRERHIRVRDDSFIPRGRRRLRIRIPLAAVV